MSEPMAARADEVALVLFTVGNERYGADASSVLRVDHPQHETIRCSPLGVPMRGERALYFKVQSECSERSVAIDELLELRRVPAGDLRRKTFALASARAALGFWLDGDRPVVLVDLPGVVPPSIPPE